MPLVASTFADSIGGIVVADQDRDQLEKQVRAAVEEAIASGRYTRYSLANAAGIGYRVLARYLDESRDIKLSTASALSATLGYVLCPSKKCKK